MKNNNKYEKGYFFKKVKNFFFNLSNIKIIFLTYLMVTLISSLLLLSPFSHKENVDVGYIDALFTAASAFSDTGLTTLITSET
jgi:Trk-type K+ transport system membrane component